MLAGPGRPFHIVCLAAAALVQLALGGCAPPPKTHVDAPSGNWISLFNGKNLDGWTPKMAGAEAGDNYKNTYRVEHGVLQVSYRNYDKFADRFGSLFYDKSLSHYWLRLEYRFVGKAAPGAPGWTYKNSGIQLHGQAPGSMGRDQQFPVSVEFDLIGGRFIGSRPTGDVCHYGTRISIQGKPFKPQCSTVGDITIRDDAWVTALVEVDGSRRVRQIINGSLVVEYTDLALDDGNADARRLIAAGADRTLNAGYISLQSNGYPVEFRRIEILPLDAAPAAAAP